MKEKKELILAAKQITAENFRKDNWESVQRDYEYGLGISKLISFEELMNEVSKEYAKIIVEDIINMYVPDGNPELFIDKIKKLHNHLSI